MKKLNLPPTEAESKREKLTSGYREFFQEWLLDIPFQWFVTIHFPHNISIERFKTKIKKWIREIERYYFKPTLGSIGLLVEGENGPHAHLLLYGENLKDGRFDSNGNSILDETIEDIKKAENVWVKLNGKWIEPSHPFLSEPGFVSPRKERSIDIQIIHEIIGVADYLAAEKNLHLRRDKPSDIFDHKSEYLKKTATKIKRNASQSEQSVPPELVEWFRKILKETLSRN